MRKQNAEAFSLSVYNRTEQLARPKTASVNIFKGIKGLEPPAVDEEGNPIEVEPEDQRIPDMQTTPDLVMLARIGTEQYRQ